ncbi:MAG: hypothetical protein IPP44_23700 [Ideonella sp.]|jgi:hypothetical protein|nr:hypothetical protein [Ideonella sp.]
MRPLALATITSLLALSGAAQATNVGVSIGISQPGVYGRIDVGRFPQPAVVVPQPVWVQPPRMVVSPPAEPVYLWVPPGHRKHWHRHCAQYRACGVPVMFVQDRWYRDNVVRSQPAPMHRNVQFAPPPVRHVSAPPPRPVQYIEQGRSHDGRGHGHGRDHDGGRGRD